MYVCMYGGVMIITLDSQSIVHCQVMTLDKLFTVYPFIGTGWEGNHGSGEK